ncbi:hypothetical protein ACO0RG_001126 [Hanseniaspora osmophila]|uniref:Uncharacterized protein n=1 Tax=Hanseniaspora osmophila TaxID=56408 RepID=A0A1E5RNN5_9ASCO|nr:hypothetical protein AWRI3579_g764 [Hanseniaspora osmophila]
MSVLFPVEQLKNDLKTPKISTNQRQTWKIRTEKAAQIMKLSLMLAFLCMHFFQIARANTETIIIEVPSYIREDLIHRETRNNNANSKQDQISLAHSNHKTQRFEVVPNARTLVEVLDYQKSSKYMAKICWSAIHPVSIEAIEYEFDEDMSLLLSFDVVQSGPILNQKIIPINVSVDQLVLGIPVTLFSVIINIVVVLMMSCGIIYKYLWKEVDKSDTKKND